VVRGIDGGGIVSVKSLVPLLASVCLAALAWPLAAEQPEGGQPSPPARNIPGITSADAFPNGCVSCHVNMPDKGFDARLSTSMKRWVNEVDPKLMEKVRGAASPGMQLRGKHPPTTKALENIPAACMSCHTASSKMAPPFSRMLHAIHLTGGDENHFMTLFQGECTHCHKLNPKTGGWSIPSGPEK